MSPSRLDRRSDPDKKRIRAAGWTLAAICALFAALAIWQELEGPARSQRALDASADDATSERRDAVAAGLFGCDGFTVTGFSEDPLVIGFTSWEGAGETRMRVDRGMRASGWHASAQSAWPVVVYECDGKELWDGRSVTTAVVVLSDTGGDVGVVVELM